MYENDFDKIVEHAFVLGYQTGIINLASELGLISERVTERQANTMYGKRQVKEWREKGWIVGYSTGNKSIRKFYYRRSELETAIRMLEYNNLIPLQIVKRKINEILREDYFGPDAATQKFRSSFK